MLSASASVPGRRLRRGLLLPFVLLPALLSILLAAACTSPRTGAERDGDGLRVVVVSDLNGRYGSTAYEPAVHRAVALIRERWRPDLVLAAGDLVAAQKPALTDAEVRAMWAAFDAAVGAPLREAGIPFGFTLGNHDGSAYPAHARDRRLAVAHWTDPAHRPGVAFVDSTHFPVYYSVRQGGLFVLAWDASYAGTADADAMMAWVEDQLASDAARSARHRLVLGHLPLYAVAEGRDRPGEVLDDADRLRALLERYDVDTYVSGHHHAYYPGRRGALELLYTAALGQGPRLLLGHDAPPYQAVTVIDLPADGGPARYATYAFRDGASEPVRVETRMLPPVVQGHNGYVVRRDLAADSAATRP